MTRNGVLAVAVLMALIGGISGLSSLHTTSQIRYEAKNRWDTQGIPGYHLLIQMEQFNGPCVQELNVSTNSDPVALRDTCSPSWLSTLTIPRLFELSARLEQPADCYPTTSNCVCQRRWVGKVEYDETLGYPREIEWRREVRSNWQHSDYWAYTLSTGRLPSCNALAYRTRIMVMSLQPLNTGVAD